MRLDLSKPRFTQAQTCKITGLSRASIQTRLNRGQVKLVQQHPGYGAKRLLSPLDLIKLSFIEQMSRHHFSSGVAAEIADEVAEHAEKWWAQHPESIGERYFDVDSGKIVEDDDAETIWLKAHEWPDYWRLAVYTNADGVTTFESFQLSDDDFIMLEREFFPDIYTVIQIDVLISRIINRILRFIHEEPKK